MAAELLVDTSAWIELLREGAGAAADRARLALRNRSARITDVVATELLRGAKSKRDLRAIDDLFAVVGWLAPSREIHLDAGRLGQRLAREGVMVPTVDLVIAQTAIAHRTALLSLDRHFELIAARTRLELVDLRQ